MKRQRKRARRGPWRVIELDRVVHPAPGVRPGLAFRPWRVIELDRGVHPAPGVRPGLAFRPWRVIRWCLVLAVLVSSCGQRRVLCPENSWAQEDDEVLAQLAAWRQEPLDLRSASAQELTLFPWLDAGLAQAIVGLRRRGGLRHWEDLLSVPGLGREELDAIAPFVHWEEPGPPLNVVVENFGRWSGAAVGKSRSRARVSRGAVGFSLDSSQGPQQRWRGIGWWRGERFQLVVGDVCPRLAWPLLLANPSLRARTAAPAFGGRARVRTTLSSMGGSWRGAAVEWTTPVCHLLLVGGRDASTLRRHGMLVLERGDEGAAGEGMAVLLRRALALWWRFHGNGLKARVEWAREFSPGVVHGGRFSAALRVNEGASAFGLALTEAPGSGSGGQDPLTGQLLDRSHHVAQADLRLHSGRWTATLLARVRRRGWTGALREDRRWQGELAGPLPRGRLRLQWRQDETEESEDARVVQLWWRENRGGRAMARGLHLRHQRQASSNSLLVGLRAEGGRAWPWGVECALVRGDRSSPWSVGVPVSGVASTWIAPGEMGGLTTLAHRTSSFRFGLWLRLRSRPGQAVEWSGGWGMHLGWKKEG